MRYLTIVRHAEALPATGGQSDYDRRLSDRGRTQCEQLREWASDPSALGLYGPTTALVSGAARTLETFRRGFEDTAFVQHVETSSLIYNGKRDVTAEDVLIDLAAIDPVTTSLLVVAHNPTVHELMHVLCSSLPEPLQHEGYPLAGAFVLQLSDKEQIGLRHYECVASFIPD
jgi:phosphohistidine phosphatase